jgi:hypothetical protein
MLNWQMTALTIIRHQDYKRRHGTWGQPSGVACEAAALLEVRRFRFYDQAFANALSPHENSQNLTR